jgi:hypothetical protein
MDDDRFIRDGRTLRDWLPDLIDPTPLTRRRAENAVSAMWWGAPIADATTYLHLPPDPEAHRAEWGRQIQAVLNDPAFPGVVWIETAMQRMHEDRELSNERWAIENALLDAQFDKPLSKSEEERMQARFKELVELETAERPRTRSARTCSRWRSSTPGRCCFACRRRCAPACATR